MIAGKKTIFAILLSCAMLSGCSADSALAPIPGYMEIINADLSMHSPDFQQGWRDGCQTGLAVYGNDYYKSYYGFTRDTTKIANRRYETAWTDAYHYCRHYVNTWLQNDSNFFDLRN